MKIHFLARSAVSGGMLNPRALTHAQLADIVADVQAILWQESRMLPDDPRQYGQYWNPAKEWEPETVEEIADVLDDFRPPDFMPVDLAVQLPQPPVIDANELLWAVRILEAECACIATSSGHTRATLDAQLDACGRGPLNVCTSLPPRGSRPRPSAQPRLRAPASP